MKIRRYYVQDMKEGMLRIREELGPEAVIIQSRKVRLKGLRGIFAPRKMEITAAVESPSRAVESEHQYDRNVQSKIQEELSELKMMVNRLMNRDFIPSDIRNRERKELQKWRLQLQRQEVLEELIDEFMTEIQESLFGEIQLTEEITGLILRKKMRKRLKTAPEKGAQIQVFVGPTGAGKTTTLAKLAARYALYQGERVGIITIDHYRIGAVEQLRTYADITGLPLEVVMTPRELRHALDKLSGCQRILIDTAGRSTLNLVHIQELANYLDNLPPAEIFMVISATTKAQDLRLISENFRCMNYNRLIFTKLDETNTYGVLLNGIYLTGLPVIYITTGQSVPDDICLADLDKIGSLILGEDE
ncbi:MAG: flagellar biosynthesis protein FlhF [Firmicutes bacterium]|nr:flagellar biosynthesis protein FlhF [Bacillota bacterium]